MSVPRINAVVRPSPVAGRLSSSSPAEDGVMVLMGCCSAGALLLSQSGGFVFVAPAGVCAAAAARSDLRKCQTLPSAVSDSTDSGLSASATSSYQQPSGILLMPLVPQTTSRSAARVRPT